MTGTVMTSVEEKKRMARRLVGSGRGFAEAYGFRVTNNPASLFQVLYLSILLRRARDFRRAITTAQALRDMGWESPARLARSLHEARSRVLREGCCPRNPDEVASILGDLALGLVERYRGDLRRLRVEARYDPGQERRLLKELAGVDDGVVDLFFRDVQALWREVAPVADQHALTAARRLGLGRSATELAELAGSGESEKLAWLVGALARVDLENSYGEFAQPVRA
ncbi:endonuclease [Micromonospora sonneratiae]